MARVTCAETTAYRTSRSRRKRRRSFPLHLDRVTVDLADDEEYSQSQWQHTWLKKKRDGRCLTVDFYCLRLYLANASSEQPAIRRSTAPPRLRQLLAMITLFGLPAAGTGALVALARHSNKSRVLLMLYTLYSMLNKAHEQGGRNNGIARRMPLWKECADYFPMALHKTVDLQPGKPYVFGYHPHGVIGLGVVISIASDALGVKKLFPGVSIHPGTLDINFQVPISRDVLLSLGFVSCNESALDAVLDNGDSVLLAVGGAAESMNAAPGTNRLTLDSRMGFVRLALKHGAGLVPIFGFGESDIFEQVDNHEGTWVRWFQETFKDVTTFSPLLPYGRYGILPYRRPITVVVGAPIDVPKIQNPTEFEVRKYHRQYVDALKRLYHSHKNELLPHRKSDLVIVDEVTAKL